MLAPGSFSEVAQGVYLLWGASLDCMGHCTVHTFSLQSSTLEHIAVLLFKTYMISLSCMLIACVCCAEQQQSMHALRRAF